MDFVETRRQQQRQQRLIDKNLFNQHITKTTNYESHRFKTSQIAKISSSDLYVTAIYKYICAPNKRKLKWPVKNRPYSGRNLYYYKSTSNAFYLNNKLKFTNQITNRFVVFRKIEIVSKSKKHVIDDSNNNNSGGISITTLKKIFLYMSDRNIPVNIFTIDPIVAELCIFLFNSCLNKKNFNNNNNNNNNDGCKKKSTKKKLEMLQVHIFQDKQMKDILQMEKSNKAKIPYKTRSCQILEDNISSDVICFDIGRKKQHDKFYTFEDESIIIIDNNFDPKQKKIILNIPKDAIHKAYFDKRNNDETISYFVNKESFFYKSLPRALNYFKNE